MTRLRHNNRTFPRRSVVLSLFVGVLVAFVAAVPLGASATAGRSAAAPAPPKKPLSLSHVVLQASANNVETLTGFIAQQEGFFKRQGLTVQYLDKSSSQQDLTIAALLQGSYQFVQEIVTSAMVAAQQGAGIKAVVAIDDGAQQEIAIQTQAAAGLRIPLAGNTPAQTLRQFMALKGSHLQVAVTSFTSGTYNNLVTLCAVNGLVCQQNNSSADINIVAAGTAANQVAGFGNGTYQAIAAGVPVAAQPNSLSINMGNLAPTNNGAFFEILTTPSMISQHPDTVQAFVTAEVQAWNWAQKNPVKAEHALANMEASINNIDNTDEDQYLFGDFMNFWKTPLLTVSSFNDAVKIANTGQPTTPVTLTYNQWNDPRFVNNAVKLLKLSPPSK